MGIGARMQASLRSLPLATAIGEQLGPPQIIVPLADVNDLDLGYEGTIDTFYSRAQKEIREYIGKFPDGSSAGKTDEHGEDDQCSCDDQWRSHRYGKMRGMWRSRQRE